jgi:hypothetical protein
MRANRASFRRVSGIGVALAAVLVACNQGPPPLAAPAGSTTNCEQFGAVPIRGGEYIVQNNEWNASSPQCTAVTGAGFLVTRADFALPPDGPPATYPAIFKGCHWGNCTSGSGLPVQVATLPPVTSTWSVTVPGAAAFDVAYDLWFNKAPATGGQPNGAELMIWLNHGGGVRPAGAQVATISLGGATWDVWTGPMESWKYIAYVREEPTDSAKLDLRAFIQDSVARGYVDRSFYLIAIEAGFEVWKGGQGFATNSFDAVVGAR